MAGRGIAQCAMPSDRCICQSRPGESPARQQFSESLLQALSGTQLGRRSLRQRKPAGTRNCQPSWYNPFTCDRHAPTALRVLRKRQASCNSVGGMRPRAVDCSAAGERCRCGSWQAGILDCFAYRRNIICVQIVNMAWRVVREGSPQAISQRERERSSPADLWQCRKTRSTGRGVGQSGEVIFCGGSRAMRGAGQMPTPRSDI